MSHLSDRFLSLSACKCRICARNTTFAWNRQQHQHQPWHSSLYQLDAHANVLSALDSLALESRHELPTGCAPTMRDVPRALSGLALHWHRLDKCTLVAFDCLLCTGKCVAVGNRRWLKRSADDCHHQLTRSAWAEAENWQEKPTGRLPLA